MRGAREKLHFMDFKQRIHVAAASLNVSSGCEEMGEQENTEISKNKSTKKSIKVTGKKTKMLFETKPCETLVPCECCSKVQTSSPNLRWDFLEAPILKPLMKLGSSIKAVTIYITQLATGPACRQPPVHFRWTTLRLRATQHNANVTLPRSGNQKRALRNIFAVIHPKTLPELPCINSCINGRYYWPMLNSDYNCILVRKFPGPKIDPKIGHSFLPSALWAVH